MMASALFETAVFHGSPLEAYYYLAQIHSAHADTPGMPPAMASSSCAMAVSFYKIVSERGVWGDDLLRDAEIAWASGTDRGKEVAMLKWWIAAERGSEIAQNNLAHVWDQGIVPSPFTYLLLKRFPDKSVLRLTRFAPTNPSNETARLALTQWTRAAAQRNIDALVKVGDYYYHGLGVWEDTETVRFEKAAKYYQAAADTQQSALAMWNLGWMYENGVGVPQVRIVSFVGVRLIENGSGFPSRQTALRYGTGDEHGGLISRIPFLDQTLRKEFLALSHGWPRWFEHLDCRRGRELYVSLADSFVANLDCGVASPPKAADMRTLDTEKDPSEDPALEQERTYIEEEDGSGWYLGKASEDFRRRKSSQDPQDDDDPVQVFTLSFPPFLPPLNSCE